MEFANSHYFQFKLQSNFETVIHMNAHLVDGWTSLTRIAMINPGFVLESILSLAHISHLIYF
jgi:hypothetical protein